MSGFNQGVQPFCGLLKEMGFAAFTGHRKLNQSWVTDGRALSVYK